ncbi:MAG: MFS transporter [Saprospiraceae bacterium]
MTKLSFWTKVWYGYGNIGNAVKTVVFSTFLFFYYNQILGLSGKMCGMAVFIALCFDAINDPLIGLWSDRTISKKWGNRLLFMVFGGFPFALFLFCLFIPPSYLSQTGLFIWFIIFAVLTRTAQTFFQIPYLSLGAELTDDYVERSDLYSYVQFFGFAGNVFVAGAGYLVFFKSTEQFDNGMLNVAMYPYFGMYAAVLILLGSYLSIFGIYRDVLKRTSHIKINKKRFYKSFLDIINNKSFKNIIIGLAILMIINATGEILSTYLFLHFWGIKPEEIAIYLAIPFFLGLLIAMWLSPKTVKWFDKKNTLIYSIIGVWLITTVLISLKLFNIIPDDKTTIIIALMIGVGLINVFAPLILITINSVFADIADEIHFESQNQQTGTLFSIRALLSKLATGVGSLFAGILLDAIHFPKGAEIGTVSESVSFNLGLVSGPLLAAIGLIPIFFFMGYKIDKNRHLMMKNTLLDKQNQI